MRKITVTLDGKLLGPVGEVRRAPSPTGVIGVPVVATLSPGTYNYQAESENGHKWQGSVAIINGKTAGIILGRFNAKPIDPNETNLTFYSSTLNSAGPELNVYLNGEYVGHTLSNYDPATLDLCIAKWVVSVVRPKGTFNYTASSATGKNWSGSVSVQGKGDCELVKFE